MNKSMKPSKPVARQQDAALTPEQRQEAMLRFFTQKRESFTTGILFNMCQTFSHIPTDAECHAMVDRAVSMADHLIEKLYPLNEPETTESAEE